MANADPTRNYYADLKVPANASEKEIRKAFLTLALQYHPDRNPGRETEFVPKFQEIQAAHEILCDQTQRTKYDAERRKYRNLNPSGNASNTPRARPPPPSRNAYTTTTRNGSYYGPPPPKPPPPASRPAPPQQHDSYASGGDRFTNKNFQPPPTAQRPDTRAKDAEARTNIFTAWQQMKTPRAEEPRPYNARARTNPNIQSTPNARNAQNQQSNPNGTPFGRTPSTRMPSSKKGFDPGTPGGDDGQARSAYRNYARPVPTPPSSTTPPHPAPPMKDSLGNDVPPPPTWDQASFTTPQGKQSKCTAGNMPNSFKSRSEESINMKFSPSDWHSKFEASSNYFAPSMQNGAGARGRTSPTRGRPLQRTATERGPPTNTAKPPPVSPFSQSQSQYPSYPIPPPPPGPPPNLNFPPPGDPTQAAKFKPEEWSNYFKEPSWVFSDQKETSPRRASEAPKRPKAGRKASAPQDKRSKVQDQTQEPQAKKYQATADDATAGDVDAMDIDTSTPPVQNTDPAMTGSQRVSVPPQGVNGSASTTTKPPAPGLNGVTAAMVDDATFSAPTSSMGLNGIGDALPFPSAPSKIHPTKPNSAQKLKFPNMPKPPVLPTTYDQIFVDLYFQRFETYCKDYMKATKEMTAHFVGRDAELATNLDDRFAHHRGETSKKLGFASYLARMKEDEQVLETWVVYQQNHITAMAQCEEVRNRTMKLYQTPVA
jgi:curved DNA-binding protein CbpA